jgi:hypothetical protein
MFRPPSLLAPQIVPCTLRILPQGSRGLYVRAGRGSLPPRVSDMLTARRQAIGGTGTCTPLAAALSAAPFLGPPYRSDERGLHGIVSVSGARSRLAVERKTLRPLLRRRRYGCGPAASSVPMGGAYRPNMYCIYAVDWFFNSGAFCMMYRHTRVPPRTAMYCLPLTE